jgi:hypothetical protein
VAYQLEFPPQLSDVHDVFHVSQLKKCLCVPEEQIPMEDLDAKEDFRNIREGYSKQEDQDVQGAMESPHRGRSYLGKRRRIEGEVSKFLFRSVRISVTRFILKGKVCNTLIFTRK